ncbi:serine hydrolase domain-containing protein [Cohnella sp. 56]|uniref:serine hydrolase domain-containing protein n=1 Tax=Cohnella sp. 56 TaxID=3113722 RepID=UPI0030E9EFF8
MDRSRVDTVSRTLLSLDAEQADRLCEGLTLLGFELEPDFTAHRLEHLEKMQPALFARLEAVASGIRLTREHVPDMLEAYARFKESGEALPEQVSFGHIDEVRIEIDSLLRSLHDRELFNGALLALLIERASGLPFADFMDRFLFQPLGMNRTSIYNRRKKPSTIDNYAYGYVYDRDLQQYRLPDDVEGLELVVFLDGIQGDGTVNATLMDLYRFDQAIRSGSLLPQKAWAEAFEPARLNGGETCGYGFGWILGGGEDTGPWSAHNGGWPGYSTCMYRYDNGGQTIIILSNTDKDAELSPLIVEAVHAILNGKPYRIPEHSARHGIQEE